MNNCWVMRDGGRPHVIPSQAKEGFYLFLFVIVIVSLSCQLAGNHLSHPQETSFHTHATPSPSLSFFLQFESHSCTALLFLFYLLFHKILFQLFKCSCYSYFVQFHSVFFFIFPIFGKIFYFLSLFSNIFCIFKFWFKTKTIILK